MKKNILTIVILAATLVNITLTAVMLFVVVPNAKRMDALLTKTLQILELEVGDEQQQGEEEPQINISDIKVHNIEEELTIALRKTETDTRQHYAVVRCALSTNGAFEDFENLDALLTTHEVSIKEFIQEEVGVYSFDEVLNYKEEIKEAVLLKTQQLFGSEFVIRVTFSKFLVE